MKNYFLNFVSRKKITIDEEHVDINCLGNEEIAGHTIFSMISSGTEIHASFLDVFDWGYPKKSGYTSVFKVEYVGDHVQGFAVGDIAFCMAPHQSFQKINFRDAVKIPAGILPEHALFIRLAGVPMATLSRTSITPGEKVLVTGLGVVGLMAMHIYSNLGYDVIGVDPDEKRQKTAMAAGFKEIYGRFPFEKYPKTVGLALECSGNEAAVLDCCNAVRPHGEVSLVGVPWKPYTDMRSYELLHSVFYNYVRLYSGWEMDLPMNSTEFVHESMCKNYSLALKMISEGKIDVSGLYQIRSYTDAQSAYEDILEKRTNTIATIFSYN